jgi:1-acyl-sn-glycerol-3-phosphate acyltransferase
LLAKIFFGFSVKGVENFPKTGSIVIACNHASYLDPPLVALAMPRKIYSLARKTLFKNAWFAAFITYYGACPVSHNNAKGMLTALRLLREDKPLLLFPEGTRTVDGKLQPIKSGAAWLAVHGKCSIIPVWIAGTYEAYPKGGKFPKMAKITIDIGKPFNPTDMGGMNEEETIILTTQELQNRMNQFEQKMIEQRNISTE